MENSMKPADVIRIQYELSLALSEISDLTQASLRVLQAAAQIAGVDGGGMYLCTDTSIQLIASIGISQNFIDKAGRYPLQSPQMDALRRRRPIYIESERAAPLQVGLLKQEGVRSIAILPIHHLGQPIASLNLLSHHSHRFSSSARRALEGIAAQVGGAIARLQAQADFRLSESKFRQIFWASPIGIEICDNNGRLLDLNPACLVMFGIADVEAIRGFNLFDDPNLPPDLGERLQNGRSVNLQVHFDFDLVRRLSLYPTTRAGLADLDLTLTRFEPDPNADQSGILVQIQEITERIAAEKGLNNRLLIEQLLSNVSNRFVRVASDQVDHEIELTLESIAALTESDRCTFWISDTPRTLKTYEWNRPGVVPIGSLSLRAAKKKYPWLSARLQAAEPVVIGSLHDLPPEAAAEKDICERTGTEAAAIIPVYLDNALNGALALSLVSQNQHWDPQTLQMLRLAGQMLANVIERKRNETALKASEARYRLLFEKSPVGVFVCDARLRVVDCNRLIADLLGTSREDLIGFDLGARLPAAITGAIQTAMLNDQPYLQPMYHQLTRRGGFWGSMRTSPLHTPSGEVIGLVGIVEDISHRIQAEQQIKASLAEKEVLLREIHHRVKNNLQVMASLLSLQANHITDPDTRNIFLESQARVRSMSLVHEELYKSDNLARVNFERYIGRLIRNLANTYGYRPEIEFILNTEAVQLSLDTAISCGLLVNELISNSIKHAFPNGRSGRIQIDLRKIQAPALSEADGEREFCLLIVADDGIGLPNDVQGPNSDTLGMQLIHILSAQIRGRLTIRNQGGAAFEIEFPILPSASELNEVASI
jgi:PAS domain S-box-containing protein